MLPLYNPDLVIKSFVLKNYNLDLKFRNPVRFLDFNTSNFNKDILPRKARLNGLCVLVKMSREQSRKTSL